MACNSRGLCPSCGGNEHECCGGKVDEAARRYYRAKLTKLEAVVEAQEAALSVARRVVDECGFADHAFGGLLVEFEQADAELEKVQ